MPRFRQTSNHCHIYTPPSHRPSSFAFTQSFRTPGDRAQRGSLARLHPCLCSFSPTSSPRLPTTPHCPTPSQRPTKSYLVLFSPLRRTLHTPPTFSITPPAITQTKGASQLPSAIDCPTSRPQMSPSTRPNDTPISAVPASYPGSYSLQKAQRARSAPSQRFGHLRRPIDRSQPEAFCGQAARLSALLSNSPAPPIHSNCIPAGPSPAMGWRAVYRGTVRGPSVRQRGTHQPVEARVNAIPLFRSRHTASTEATVKP